MRRGLWFTLSAASIVMVGLLMYPLLASLQPSERARVLREPPVPIGQIAPGQFKEFPRRGGVIFAFRPTAETWKDLRTLAPQTFDPTINSYNRELDLFLYWGVSTHLGCKLKHLPKGSPDAEWRPDWKGGYYDPCHAPSYDYAGRTLRAYSGAFPNMQPLRISRIYDDRLEFYPINAGVR